MLNEIKTFFSTNGFMPHGMCLQWKPLILWTQVISDIFVFLSYFTIPIALIYFIKKREDIKFKWIFVLFGAFILACGGTHLVALIAFWNPIYGIQAVVKLVTAIVSSITAVAIWFLLPVLFKIPSPWQLEQRSAQLKAANQEIEAFSYSISHDLRAPLRHLSGYAALLKNNLKEDVDKKTLEYLDVINESTEKMGKLIDGLLAFSRLGRNSLKKTRFSIEALFTQAREELTTASKDRKIQWEMGALPEIHADRDMMQLVVANLLSNAVKFTQNNELAKINISAQETDKEVIIHVSDNGSGFEQQYVDKIFGMFQRLHKKSDFEGDGIGLANVKRIISRHDGRVWASGQLHEGATVSFSLPKGGDTT